MWTTQLWHLIISSVRHALTYGSSTGISVVWLGFFLLILTYLFTMFLEWLVRGRNMIAIKTAFRSWTSLVGAIAAFIFVWLCLFAYSLVQTVFRDHVGLMAENQRLRADNQRLSGRDESPKSFKMTAEQRDAIVSHMKHFRSTTIVLSCRDCDDESGSAWVYAQQMAEAFHQAKLEVDGPHHSRDRSIPKGVYVYYGSDQLQAKTALTDALSPFHVLTDESDGSSGYTLGKMSVSIRP